MVQPDLDFLVRGDRYDRLSVIRNAWTTLAACAVCFQILTQDVF
jgi:hypothetical protein